MKYSIFLQTGFLHDFHALADPRAAYERVVEIAQAADNLGYESLLVPDHLTTLPPAQETLFEAWSLVTALAVNTTRVRLGQLVTGNGYRNPALSAKIASSVDVISGGRLVFGLGAGWYEPDYSQYGFDFETAKDRLARLNEAAQIILGMWTQETTTFAGKYYTIANAINQPKGIQRPHIPLLIAGGGEKVTLRTVARYADASNIVGTPEVARHKFAVLKQHAEDVGRDYDAINRTVTVLVKVADTDAEARQNVPNIPIYPDDVTSYGLIGSVATVRQRIAAFEDAGVQELVLHFADPTSVELPTQFAQEFIDS